MTTLELIDWQRQQPTYYDSIFKHVEMMEAADRDTVFVIVHLLYAKWGDVSSFNYELQETLVTTYGDGISKVSSIGRFVMKFDLWILVVIDLSLIELGDPAYCDVNMKDLVALVRKNADRLVEKSFENHRESKASNSDINGDNAP